MRKFLSATLIAKTLFLASVLSILGSGWGRAAQVDLGLTLGGTIYPNGNILSGKAVFLGTFTGYNDGLGVSYFTGKDYNTLFGSWTALAEVTSPLMPVTNASGQIYQSYDTGSTASGTRLFAWFYSTAVANGTAPWAIVSGGGNPTGPKATTYDPMWLAVAPADQTTINIIEAGTIYSQIYASNDLANRVLASSVFDPEGANLVIPEPSSLSLLGLGLAALLGCRRRKTNPNT